MGQAERARERTAAAVAAARAVVARCAVLPSDPGSGTLGSLRAEVLHDSNTVTVLVHPASVVARTVPLPPDPEATVARLQAEIDLALSLAAAGAPMALPDPRTPPRVQVEGSWAVTLWEHVPGPTAEHADPAVVGEALSRLHAAMRDAALRAPRYTDRVAEARTLLADPARSPTLPPAERMLLREALDGAERRVLARGAAEQLLHGEPHPGNLVLGPDGPRVIDLETCCRGPVEFDLAHAPPEVVAHCRGADRELEADCRTLVLAIAASWRFDPEDRFPDGRAWAAERIAELRARLSDLPAGTSHPARP